jgi:hypothetical protein
MRATGPVVVAMFLVTGVAPARAQIPADSLTSLSRRAYVFGFPALEMYRTMYASLTTPGRGNSFNVFAHRMQLQTPGSQTVVNSNNDTFFSLAWLDLRGEGVVLTIPAAPPARYRSAQVVDQFTHNVAILSEPSPRARRYLLVGPHWRGRAPADVSATIRTETGFVAVLTRTGVYGRSDSAAAAAVQTAFALEALGSAGEPSDLPEYRADLARSADFVRYLDFVLANGEMHATEKDLVRSFTPVGVRAMPGASPPAWSPEERAAIDRGVSEALALIRNPPRGPPRGRWSFSDIFGNRARMQGRYLARAVAAMFGLFGLDREEAAYFGTSNDNNGQRLRGDAASYTMRFPPDSLPPGRAFWSLTVYDSAGFMVPNAIERYSIGDRTAELRRDPDGGLTIYLQRDSPSAEHRSNWLPVPDGAFELSLRLYRPDPEAILSYTPPPVQVRRSR